jgi:ribonuclease D
MQIEYIDNTQVLQKACQQFSTSTFLAIDTEFFRQTTYYSILALIQICDGEKIAIVDPVAIKDLHPLMELLYNKNITKVFHSSRQDLEIFYHMNGSLPEPLFDTQVAAALLGFGEQIGYAPLVKQLLKVELDKSQTRTDWLKRPLNKKQLSYAADDVKYLAQIYPLQLQKLIDTGRLSWLENDFNFLTENSTYAVSSQSIWRKTKGVNRLKKQKLAILKHLSAWREELAIQQNRPRRRVISDDTLIGLCNNPPQSSLELQEHPGLSEQFVEYNKEHILSLVKKGLVTPDNECPKLPPIIKLSQNEEALADCMMAIVHLSANNNDISPQCLCSRKEINALIKGQRDLNILSGWRTELAGKSLLDFLAGKGHLECSSGQLKLSYDTISQA